MDWMSLGPAIKAGGKTILMDPMKETHRCRSEKETMDLAAGMARKLKGGEVFALAGDLGCGKTTFVKGLALGLQSPTTVTSPTFNLVHRYVGKQQTLIHYDLYRLKKIGEIEALDLETELHGGNILAIEWPQLVASILPEKRTRWIEFREVNDTEREVTISLGIKTNRPDRS